MAEETRIRVFELANGKRVGKQLTDAEVVTFLADNAGSTLVR
mgnify:FL=1|jgi:hypothetical protein